VRTWRRTWKLLYVAGIDAEAARKEEEEMMMRDANQWLNAGCYSEQPHPKTGAYALHVAAAKGYIKVIKYVQPRPFSTRTWLSRLPALSDGHNCFQSTVVKYSVETVVTSYYLLLSMRYCSSRQEQVLIKIL